MQAKVFAMMPLSHLEQNCLHETINTWTTSLQKEYNEERSPTRLVHRVTLHLPLLSGAQTQPRHILHDEKTCKENEIVE